jgi:hypothetical protein
MMMTSETTTMATTTSTRILLLFLLCRKELVVPDYRGGIHSFGVMMASALQFRVGETGLRFLG